MGFVGLDQIGLQDSPRVGTKAAVLGALLRRGLPVPPGFAIPDAELWAEEAERGLPLGSGPWIVRSSATVEDGQKASFAGQLESVGGLASGAELIAAVRRICRPGERACDYARRHGLELGERIPVLVQRQIAAVRSGVLFTIDPQGGGRLCFSVDWGAAEEVTDGSAETKALTFDPFEPQAAGCADPIVARALPRLTELALSIASALRAERPLDIEWLVDTEERVWIVQARPVTACFASPDPRVCRLLDEGFELNSPRPASRLAAWSFGVAGEVDRRAASFHHGWFERRSEGRWLLSKRVKSRSRERVAARTAMGFLVAWARARRGNLAFAFGHLPSWWLACAMTDRRAPRILPANLETVSAARLRSLLAQALSLHRRVRRIHAALWYPVDLAKDLAAFEEQLGPAGLSASLPLPRRRTERDRRTAALVLMIRDAHGGEHLPWEELGADSRERILRHLVRFPYAFGSSAEVQDPAAWRSWSEEPGSWWSRQAGPTNEELERQAAVSPRPPAARASLAGALLRAVVGLFAPMKDDRVELLAKAGAVLRRVLLEVERRAGGDTGDEGWIFELEPGELMRMAAELEHPDELDQWRQTGIRRRRMRLLEGFATVGSQPSRSDPVPAVLGGEVELRGFALATGLAEGRACLAATADDAQRMLQPGDVLVIEELRPAFTAVLPRASALVCRRGSPLSHGAIIARELGMPAVALEDLAGIRPGAVLTVDGDRGAVRCSG